MSKTTVGVLRELAEGERRVALIPDGVSRLRRLGLDVMVETGAGESAWFSDPDYVAAGGRPASREDIYLESDVVLCLRPPRDAAGLHDGQMLIGLLEPLADPRFAAALAGAKVTAVSLDMLPRTLSRAQSMDVLTSQANVAGYKAVLVAANAFGGYFPMLMTAAGTTRPAQVLVLGAGVAGLQAIATARRLGAVVTAYDVRDAARADIVSTGAAVLELGRPAQAGDSGGYARALDTADLAILRQAMDSVVSRFDVVITTAQVAGGHPPLLIGERGLSGMKPGSVVVDLAAGRFGGNVTASAPDAVTVTKNGVTVIGAGNLAAQMPVAASAACSRNLTALLAHLTRDGVPAVDPHEEIQAGIIVTHLGEIIHPQVRAALTRTQERV
jgi:H+-translocating NAD(P) transhydrogenase subunit alpha